MPKFKDLTGQRFGRLTVIERAENNKSGRVCWKCLCDCGNKHIVSSNNLLRGEVKSCGCLRDDLKKENHHRFIHGMKNTPLYHSWATMKQRCFNPKTEKYSRYGGRGITIYPDWVNSFKTFYDYVSKLPHFGEKGYTLDRIDNDGNYEPNNLRWATVKEQSRNRSNNHLVDYNGEAMTLAEASEKCRVNFATLTNRIQHGEKGDYLFRLPTSKRLTDRKS